MAHQSSVRSGSRPRSHHASQTLESSTDLGHYIYGSIRNMGPPSSFDFASRPIPLEIDLNSNTLHMSRTLPNPSASATAAWDASSPVSQNDHGFVGMPFGTPNMARSQPVPADGHARTHQQNPIMDFYFSNDGPWIPQNIRDAPDAGLQAKYIGNRHANPYGNPNRHPVHLEGGHYPYTVHTPSDSGYGTRQSVGNTSVFSGDINEREDCQSLMGHTTDYPPYPPINEVLQQTQSRDSAPSEHWTSSTPTPTPLCQLPAKPSSLMCETCNKPVKTQSELKKHVLRHTKPFRCTVKGCNRAVGFSTSNDLDRHIKSKHPSALPESLATKRYRCTQPGCKSKDKAWPRLDNFRSHLRRVHYLEGGDLFESAIRRGEYVKDSNQDLGLDAVPQNLFQDDDRTTRPELASRHVNNSTFSRWKPSAEIVVTPSQDFVSPAGSLERPPLETSVQPERNLLFEAQRQGTIKAVESFFPMHDIRASSSHSILAQVGSPESNLPKPYDVILEPTSAKGKASSHKEVSALDAKAAQALKMALTNILDTSDDCAPHQGPRERIEPPNGKPAHHPPTSTGPSAGHCATSMPVEGLTDAGSASSEKLVSKIQADKVIKILREHGYILQKDPKHSPKVLNSGSAASNKSGKNSVCQRCHKFQGRPCELKKHMKRHMKPWGCTFVTCHKRFGSKNDWKRHENSQHFHLETWRCDVEKEESDGGAAVACAKVCYRRQTFQEHLSQKHQLLSDIDVKTKLETCRMGRNCQARFWCGFCTKLIDLSKKGLDAWNERFDHIDDHFSGKNGHQEQDIQDWIPLNSNEQQGDVEDLSLDKASPADSESSSSGSSSENSSPAVGSSAGETRLEGSLSRKRASSSDDDGIRAPKRTKTVIFCCQCSMQHNPRLEKNCSNCSNQHHFCSDCTNRTEEIEEEN